MAAAGEAKAANCTEWCEKRSPQSTCNGPAPMPPTTKPHAMSSSLLARIAKGIRMPLARSAKGVIRKSSRRMRAIVFPPARQTRATTARAQRPAGEVDPMSRGGGGKDERRSQAEDDSAAQAEPQHDDEEAQEGGTVTVARAERSASGASPCPAAPDAFSTPSRPPRPSPLVCGLRSITLSEVRSFSLFGCVFDRFARMRGC